MAESAAAALYGRTGASTTGATLGPVAIWPPASTVSTTRKRRAAMLACNLSALLKRQATLADRAALLHEALKAADHLLAALHECTVTPTATALAAVASAEKRYAEIRAKVDGHRQHG